LSQRFYPLSRARAVSVKRISGRDYDVEVDYETGVVRVIDKREFKEYVLEPDEAEEWLSEIERERAAEYERKKQLLEEILARRRKTEAKPAEAEIEIETAGAPEEVPVEKPVEVEVEEAAAPAEVPVEAEKAEKPASPAPPPPAPPAEPPAPAEKPARAKRAKKREPTAAEAARAAVRESGRLAARASRALVEQRPTPTAVLKGLTNVVVYGFIAAGVGLTAAVAEGVLWRAGLLGALLAALFSLLFQAVYLPAILAGHLLIASTLLAATRLAKAGGGRWRGRRWVASVVDLTAWTVLSAALAATARAVWIPLTVGFVADALLMVLTALAPVVATAVLVIGAIIILLLLLSRSLQSAWGAAIAAPFIPFLGPPIQLWSLARLAHAVWSSTDAALALLIAIVGVVARFAEPLAALALAGLWVVFGMVASASKDWRWFRIPLAASAAFAIVARGWGYDWAARATIDAFTAAAQQLNAPGLARAATLYRNLLEWLGTKL